jgi:hypothetical protein
MLFLGSFFTGEHSEKYIVTAHDDQSLGKTATATVTIDVEHNPNAPRLTSPKFETTIFEYLPLSSNILNVTANDLVYIYVVDRKTDINTW